MVARLYVTPGDSLLTTGLLFPSQGTSSPTPADFAHQSASRHYATSWIASLRSALRPTFTHRHAVSPVPRPRAIEACRRREKQMNNCMPPAGARPPPLHRLPFAQTTSCSGRRLFSPSGERRQSYLAPCGGLNYVYDLAVWEGVKELLSVSQQRYRRQDEDKEAEPLISELVPVLADA
ncbi:unnamed protein product [Protopolystoma xenopodis]|uniref:Uncharacterized protein n=1 Tax=Protopolystoma xenopodis TaxID=117903 RepID=A0A3S5AS88_9PLAT|nr:unnamed protein product [Protopolystoma xenopodis]